MTNKPKTKKEWEKTCTNLNKALQEMVQDSAKEQAQIDNLREQIARLETQLTMSNGVIKYLEIQIARSKPNSI